MESTWTNNSGFNVELTTHCNLRCPLCPRTMFREDVQLRHFELSRIRKIFTPAVIQKHDVFRFIGNHGDPIFHPALRDIVHYFLSSGAKKILINTNGSGRSESWWSKLAEVVDKRVTFLFSIDGLRDTNPIYRINSRWDDIETAIRSVGGRAKLGWKFIVFQHNQHQIDEATETARAFGFDWISFEHSDRWGEDMLPRSSDVHIAAERLKPDEKYTTPRDTPLKIEWPGNYQLMNRTTVQLRAAR